MDTCARVGDAIGMGTVMAVASFVPAGMFIDNPALLAKSLIASKVAPMLTSSGGPDGGMGSVVEVTAGMAVPEFEGQAVENRAVADAENALQQSEGRAGEAAIESVETTRGGINWNPFRAPSLEKYMPNAGNVAVVGATKNGSKAVDFLQLEANHGGRIFAATDTITGSHVDQLANDLLSGPLSQGRNIVILTGRHGSTAGFDLGMRETQFLMEDFVIAPAANNIEILDATQLSAQQMQDVLQRGDDVILGWCNSENSRQVMNALGVNVRFAPF
jgi:hypothetical protein